jgi:beta-lactam-binding protein with PASTA domain
MGGQQRVTTVPDVTGLSATTAATAVLAADLVPYGRNYSPAPTSGSITSQTPERGARAVPGAPVILEIEPGGGHGVPPGSPLPGGADEFAPGVS